MFHVPDLNNGFEINSDGKVITMANKQTNKQKPSTKAKQNNNKELVTSFSL